MGEIAPNGLVVGLTRSFRVQQPEGDQEFGFLLWEAKGQGTGRTPFGVDSNVHEQLSVWPVSDGGSSETVSYIDILTDTDGDGTGDVNERIAGTDPHDAASAPGASTVDVLWLYQDTLRTPDLLAEYHHAAVVTNAMFVDSGTNIRLRSVGFAAVEGGEIDEHGGVAEGVYGELMDRHGADVSHFVYDWQDKLPDPCPSEAGGCAWLGDSLERGAYSHARSYSGSAHPETIAHELGHVMGLAHSARQAENHGSFRWSRGHYVGEWKRQHPHFGTIMSYGWLPHTPVFSSPASERCRPFGGPCGLPATHPQGADAVASLNLIRFQVAGERKPKLDSDGDGFVDAADAFPQNPNDWTDFDGDGLGDNEDPDKDGDGVANPEDLFSLDPDEWADLDGDGLGDNTDPDVDGDGVANADDLFPADALDWADSDGDGVGDNAQALHPFRDVGLRSIVERRLGKPEGTAISVEDMAQLETLEAHNANVEDLTGLELAEGLTKLVINVTGWGTRGRGRKGVADLSPLADLVELQTVWLSADPRLSDLSPLAGLRNLNSLKLLGHWEAPTRISGLGALADLPLVELALTCGSISEVSTVGGLAQLTTLQLDGNQIEDISDLSQLSRLESLGLRSNQVADISSVGGLAQLTHVDLAGNLIEDISPLAGLSQLRHLYLDGNEIEDVSSLAELSQLRSLNVRDNRIQDEATLAGLSHLESLSLGGNPISATAFLAQFMPESGFFSLGLQALGLTDLSPLVAFMNRSGPQPWNLDLSDNPIADIGPLAKRSFWDLEHSWNTPGVYLFQVPLDQDSVERHIPELRSWGIDVQHSSPISETTEDAILIPVPDANLRNLLQEATAAAWWLGLVDDPITAESASRLKALHAFGRGIFDLTGLEAAEGLQELHVGSNGVSNLAPLADLALEVVDIDDNLVTDLSPLVAADSLETLYLDRNPLNEESLNTHIPALRKAGARVELETVEWTVAANGTEATFDTSGYFASLLGTGATFTVDSSNPALASADMTGGELTLAPGPVEGRTTVTVTATNRFEESATLKFDVAVARPREVPLFPAAAETTREGFLRVINRSDEVGMVRISAIDGSGQEAPSVSLALAAGAAAHFNSGDLETGNATKRLAGGTGAGTGDWRLSLLSRLVISAPSYIRTTDGFVTAMHDLVPEANGKHRVATFNPGSNFRQVSRLRLVNTGSEDASVAIRGVDDAGVSPGGPVQVSVEAGSDLVLAADELESGTGLDGALGDGKGKWRLAVSSDQPLRVMSLMESPTGHLTNLSTVPVGDGDGFIVPLFPSASDPLGRQGFMRVINNGESAAEVRISVLDDSDWTYDPLTLTVPANGVTHINSDDLELGNADKGLVGRTGAGQGHWRLALSSPADIDVLAYIRTKDGFLTSMHDLVPSEGNRHAVAFLNAGSNNRQVSRLRLTNSGDATAQVKVTGIDSEGTSPGGVVRITLPAGAAHSFTAAELEAGTEGLTGALGDGAGKWRLTVESDQPIAVMSLLETPTGHLTNLSTAPDALDDG
ncbi:MAG: leucine-rich repeat domain-containing protein [Gammaproteobacteria bacterium]|nr:leucine-rich repeat domain-containing protein [Gammaproteobacteria bacterium]MDE0273570.1 leucine-rich repeat domain-containing protein [Gammaproteobacteria bacterium]